MMLKDVKLHLVECFDDAEKLMTWLGTDHNGPITFDCETTGLSPEVDRIRLFQVGDANDGWAVPFEEWTGLVRAIVERWEGRWIGHNARF